MSQDNDAASNGTGPGDDREGETEPYLGDIPAPADNPGGVMAAITVLSTELGETRAETRAELGELRAHLGDTLARLTTVQSQLPPLASEVTALAANVAELLDQGPPESPPQPVDLAHIPVDERRQVLADLAVWVRDTLVPGWPWVQERLRGCWPLHADIVNGLLWVRCAYQTAYDHKAGRAHHAADFHHWLREVIAAAAEETESCPASNDDRPHLLPPIPRDDGTAAAEAARLAELAEIHQYVPIAQSQNAAPETVQRARQESARLLQQYDISREEYLEYAKRLLESDTARFAKRSREQMLQTGKFRDD
jgi:hypothetical protein